MIEPRSGTPEQQRAFDAGYVAGQKQFEAGFLAAQSSGAILQQQTPGGQAASWRKYCGLAVCAFIILGVVRQPAPRLAPMFRRWGALGAAAVALPRSWA